jgi:cytochrome c oxidase subunit IV
MNKEIQNTNDQPVKSYDTPIKTYLIVWLILIGLTALTVTSASFFFGSITIIIVLSIAALKSILVFLYFMHLKYERRLLIKLLIPGIIILLTIFIGLTFTDVMNR